jgi:uncharacterized membrane protein YedE/YeeE
MRQRIVALIAGFVFAIGLGISGMTDPRKVIAFLDVTGAWDPSLALVMMSAIGVHAVAARWARGRARPILADSFALPVRRSIDGRLILGAALFGAGWGTAGFCPGPAIVALAGLSAGAFVFSGAMIVGIALYRWFPAIYLCATGERPREVPSDE